ncbi:MAG: hypothetical protein O6926_10480 [candidate division NC10 bacterium]|nr:hypothetical protein [candidate division NC10 bacterium]
MIGKIRKRWGREEVATCKLCGVRLEKWDVPCPDCGYLAGSESNVFYIPGDEGGREKEKEAGPLETSDLAQEAIDPTFDDVVGPGGETELEDERRKARPVQKMPNVNPPMFALDPAGLRKLLAKQPEILEPGLTVYTDKGRPVGAAYSSGVGPIDLLARDASGVLVVVKVAERGQGEELLPATLQRIGWVRKHLGKGKEKVRGIILVEQAPENLSYTASAMEGTITFKTYRVAVTFEDVEM